MHPSSTNSCRTYNSWLLPLSRLCRRRVCFTGSGFRQTISNVAILHFSRFDRDTTGISLSGHPKTGQRWSGQNRPTEEAGDSVVLPRGFLRRQVYFRAPTSRTAFENMTVMEEAIEHGGDGCAVTQPLSPVRDASALGWRSTGS